MVKSRYGYELKSLDKPAEGWLVAMCKAIGMSGSEVASRMGLSRNAVYQAERNERDGAITINQMQKLAQSMGGEFVYAIVPKGRVEDLILGQARYLVQARVERASVHMALEKQSLTRAQIKQRIEEVAQELAHDMPAEFWSAK